MVVTSSRENGTRPFPLLPPWSSPPVQLSRSSPASDLSIRSTPAGEDAVVVVVDDEHRDDDDPDEDEASDVVCKGGGYGDPPG